MKKVAIVFLLPMLAWMATGCSQQVTLPKPTIEGRGRILLPSGEPGKFCTIMLTPVERKKGMPCYANTTSDGSFVLKTGNEEGVVPGMYRVALRPFINSNTPGDLVEDILASVPQQYQDDETSPFVISVQSEADLMIKFK